VKKTPTVQLINDTNIETPLGIVAYMHCGLCIEEWKKDPAVNTVMSPGDYARTQTGLLRDGSLQVWCNRHNVNVAVITARVKEGA
jgi:hypothetical protein